MSINENYRRKIRSHLRELHTRVDQLKARVEHVDADRRVRFDRYLDVLEKKRSRVGDKLGSMDVRASRDDIKELNNGLKDAWQRLAIARRAAKARFN